MKHILEAYAGDYEWYKARRPEYDTGRKIPFRVSPEPLQLTKEQTHEIEHIGYDVTQFIHAANELYRNDTFVHHMLDMGKPTVLLTDTEPKYLFVRPDLIITPLGFCMCEIETSPFGLGLAELLNESYRANGSETLVDNDTLSFHVRANTPTEGTLIYSKKTSPYSGQLSFLADKIFSGNGRLWNVSSAETASQDPHDKYVYRAFYQSEYLTDPAVRTILNAALSGYEVVLPTLTPHLEEKAILALLWDKRWEGFFQKQLGNAIFNHLRQVVPPTWIISQEKYFTPGMPDGISESIDLANLSRSKRTLVMKPSGFSSNSSWSEGVIFLHEKSADAARDALQHAKDDTETLYVIQEFRKAKNIPMSYEQDNGESAPMMARIRLTPYFSMTGTNEGKLIAIKATCCENTDFIHASSISINTAVAQIP